jgi:hypothetical protein
MSLEITGIRDLNLDEWDHVSGGRAAPIQNDMTLSDVERAGTTVSIVPCDFKDFGGNIGFTNVNVCWMLTDNETGEGTILPSSDTLDGQFAGGPPVDPPTVGPF